MDDQAKLEKTLKMLMLLSNGIGYTRQQIAEKYEMSDRTVSRYIETFRRAGFVIDYKNGYYSISKNIDSGKTIADLMHFSEEEAYILSRAIHSIDNSNVLKSELVKKLYALYDTERIGVEIIKKENSENVHNLMKGIRNHKQVILRNYCSGNSRRITDRLVEPFGFNTNYIDVWCYEVAVRKNKTFKTERIGQVIVTDNEWQHALQHKEDFTDVFRISGKAKINVKIRLSLRARNLLIEEYPLAEKYILPNGDNTYIFDGWVCNFTGICRFVMGLPGEVEMLGPSDFVDYVSQKQKVIGKIVDLNK